MRKSIRILIMLMALFAFATAFGISASASQGTTYTYTISNNGDWIRTQEAYVPSMVYLKDAGLSKPNDIFIYENLIYVADTGNRRIVILDRDSGEYSYIENDNFMSPMGIFVNGEKIYIADSGAEAVYITDMGGNLIQTILRPENSPLMSSASIFKPLNVVVSKEGNIFVVGEGSYDGLMQFSPDGEFQGYFAANKRSLTVLEKIQELFYTREQKAQLLTRKPSAIQNIDISSRDLIYSVTQSDEVKYTWVESISKTSNALKMHNMAGTNILSTSKFMDDEWNFVDVVSGPYNNVYALTYTGLIYEYDSSGNLIFSFGGRAVSNDRYGLFTYASAIDLDENSFIYVLDKERALIQVFVPTDFAVATHKAIYDLENGNYEDAEENWKNVLQLNGMSRIAHVGYGKSLMRQQLYSEALGHFKIAGDVENYSECFWEIRKNATNNAMPFIISLLFIVLFLVLFRQFFLKKRKKKVYSSYGIIPVETKGFSKFTTDIVYSFTILKHPIDANYYLKKGTRGSVISSTVLLLFAFVIYMADLLCRGFIFNVNNNSELTPLMLTLLFFIVIFLFVIGNYMVATINDGEGSLKNIYIMFCHSLMPYILISPAVIILTYCLTLNEAFIINVLWTIGIVWAGALIFVGVIHVHNYSFRQTIKNILLTLFFMILALVVVAMLYLVWNKVDEFIGEIVSEVTYRVQK